MVSDFRASVRHRSRYRDDCARRVQAGVQRNIQYHRRQVPRSILRNRFGNARSVGIFILVSDKKKNKKNQSNRFRCVPGVLSVYRF